MRDSFRVALPAILDELGAEVAAIHRVGDDTETTRAAIGSDPVDLVVTTGGTGHSDVDRVGAAARDLGAEFLVPSVAMRPGGPTFLARTPDRLILGLPGNPLAAVLGLLAVGGPLLEAWTGRPTPPLTVVVEAGLDGRPGTTRLVPVAVRDGVATPTAHAGSAHAARPRRGGCGARRARGGHRGRRIRRGAQAAVADLTWRRAIRRSPADPAQPLRRVPQHPLAPAPRGSRPRAAGRAGAAAARSRPRSPSTAT